MKGDARHSQAQNSIKKRSASGVIATNKIGTAQCPEIHKLAEDLHIKTGKNRLIAAIMATYYHIYGH